MLADRLQAQVASTAPENDLREVTALGYERRDLAALNQALEQMAGGDRASHR